MHLRVVLPITWYSNVDTKVTSTLAVLTVHLNKSNETKLALPGFDADEADRNRCVMTYKTTSRLCVVYLLWRTKNVKIENKKKSVKEIENQKCNQKIEFKNII